MKMRTMALAAAAWLLAIGMAAAATAPDSKRMSRAKEFIDDEQWGRAVAELQAAVADPKEANRDEALFWLAYSQHQAGDEVAALESLATLERTAPSSRWVRLGRSLRIEIAHVLRRDDWILPMVAPPAPMPPAQPAPPVPLGRPGVAVPPPPAMVTPAPAPPAPGAPSVPAPITPRPGRAPRAVPPPAAPAAAPPAPPVPAAWSPFTEFRTNPDAFTDGALKVQALSLLVEAHGEQAVPMLREIALDHSSPDEARQAVFVLAQSRRADARRTVVEVAHQGAEPVRIAAVRELGHFEGASISSELMQVYTMSGTPPRLKRQVISSLAERSDNVSLLRIVKSESEPGVRDSAIRMLGRTGAREQLRLLYPQTPNVSRPAVLMALFTVKDDDELIRIARTERDPALRARARQQLRLLSTPKAVKFLEENP